MPNDDKLNDGEEQPRRRSKSPTWVGTVMSAKDAQIEAIKDLADDKMKFMVDRLDAEYKERESRSAQLIQMSDDRAEDMQKSLIDKNTTVKRLWIVIVVQTLIIAALAGVTVTGKLPFVGDINLDAAKSSEK